MLKNFLITISLLLPMLSYASDQEPNETPQIGRYQMVSAENGRLYLLDTTNGNVWRSASQTTTFWLHDTWVLQIADFTD